MKSRKGQFKKGHIPWNKGKKTAGGFSGNVSKEQVLEYLEEKGINDGTDAILVDELFDNIKLANRLKKELKGDLIVTTRQGQKLNPAVDGYSKVLRNITAICTKLGMTVQDRQKLKLVVKDDDELSDFD